ncbi:hypothetical protein EMCRGX_G029292 [Ephydatia muelleri]
MASPNPVLSADDSTAGPQPTTDTSRSPYKLVYCTEDSEARGWSHAPSPTSSESNPLVHNAPTSIDPKGGTCLLTVSIGHSTYNGQAMQGDGGPVNGADGRLLGGRAESPLSLTDGKVENVGNGDDPPGADLEESAVAVETCQKVFDAIGKKFRVGMKKMSNANGYFSVEGTWNTDMAFLSEFNTETPKGSKQQYLTLAADLILESVEELIRFVRELKIKCIQPKALQNFFSGKICTKDSPHLFVLSLKKAWDSTPAKPLYSLDELKNKTAPDEKSSVSAELARKAIVKLKVKEESESHDDIFTAMSTKFANPSG